MPPNIVTLLGASMSAYILRPFYSKVGHLRPDREFDGKQDIEYHANRNVPPKW